MSEESRFRRPVLRVALQCGLLFLATTHLILSYFFTNFSWIDLVKYENGVERNPYQERVAMMPLLRWAHASAPMQHLAAAVRDRLGHHLHSPFKEATPESIVSMMAALVCAWLLMALLLFVGRRRFGELGWIVPSIALVLVAASMSSRYESAVWYPYDLPHMFLFGAASVAILCGRWWIATAFFLLDIPMRETSVFLLPVMGAVAWSAGRRRLAMALPVLLFLVWASVQWAVHHRFAQNVSDTGVHLNLGSLLSPVNWPQMASAFGFLAVPLILGVRRLPPSGRAFLLGAVPGILLTVMWGILTETRIFSEWTAAAALLLSFEVVSLFREMLPSLPE